MAVAKTCSTTIGVFETREAAERAITDLKAAGYRDDQIGLVARNEDDGHAGSGAATGAAVGAIAGAAIGAGVLTGAVPVLIPIVGPGIALGTMGTILANTAGGAALAGIAGALIGWGVPEEDARYYEDEVKAGRYLVTVDCGDQASDVRSVFGRHGGYDRAGHATRV